MIDLSAGLGAAVAFFVCIIGHEVATAQAAASTGDRSPRLYGRLTLSPKAHVDPIGTLILPIVFTLGYLFSAQFAPVFGWGKRHALGSGRRSLLPPLAGPAITLAVAFGAAMLLRAGGGSAAEAALYVACSLTVVELLPIPGRDGGRVLRAFLSPSGASKFDDLERYEVVFLLVIFLIEPLRVLVIRMIDPLYSALAPATAPLFPG